MCPAAYCLAEGGGSCECDVSASEGCVRIATCLAVLRVDCKAALRTPTSAVARDKYPGLASEIRAALTRASVVGVQLSFVWVPSHGKRPAWEAPAGMCSELLRLLNDKTDRAAEACRLRRFNHSRRQQWWHAKTLAAEWEYQAILASAAAGNLLHDHVRRSGTRPQEHPLLEDHAQLQPG